MIPRPGHPPPRRHNSSAAFHSSGPLEPHSRASIERTDLKVLVRKGTRNGSFKRAHHRHRSPRDSFHNVLPRPRLGRGSASRSARATRPDENRGRGARHAALPGQGGGRNLRGTPLLHRREIRVRPHRPRPGDADRNPRTVVRGRYVFAPGELGRGPAQDGDRRARRPGRDPRAERRQKDYEADSGGRRAPRQEPTSSPRASPTSARARTSSSRSSTSRPCGTTRARSRCASR